MPSKNLPLFHLKPYIRCFERKYFYTLFSKSLQQVDQKPSSEFSLWENHDVPLRDGIGRGSLCKPKSLNFSLLLDITPTKKLSLPVPSLITDQILKKNVSLIAFRQILPKILPVACIFSYTNVTFGKARWN